MKTTKNILPQMFDVKPVNSTGEVDVEKISSVNKTIEIRNHKKIVREKEKEPAVPNKNKETYEFSMQFDEKFELWAKKVRKFEQDKKAKLIEQEREAKKAHEAMLLKQDYEKMIRRKREQEIAAAKEQADTIKGRAEEIAHAQIVSQKTEPEKASNVEKKQSYTSIKGIIKQVFSNYQELDNSHLTWKFALAKPALSFATAGFSIIFIIGAIVYASYGFQIQKEVQVLGQQAIGHLEQASNDLKEKDFDSVNSNIENAAKDFAQAQKDIELLGGNMLDIVSGLPMLSKVSSAKNVVYAGNEIVLAAKELSVALPKIARIQNPLDENIQNDVSMIDIFQTLQSQIDKSRNHFDQAQEYIEKVRIEDLPTEYQDKFRGIKMALPVAISTIDAINQHSEIFLELLGDNGPRKYLIIFQNNNEMRATGGFIGSYGIVHIMNGHVRKVLIEGIFNPDGQFKEDIIPPRPLQKITAGWSTHDANWYPHFPKSAKKIASFYEKTGGPTIDGIITMTPAVLEKMLEVTGPIEMKEYGAVVTAENFIQITQYEVEIDYDREENRPKKFLADLAPVILEKMFNQADANSVSKTIMTFTNALKEKHILMYSYEEDIQNVISKMGWSGEIKQTQNDFLMVVNSNINGYKTDGVIDETISHKAEIMPDGSIIDTVNIKRVHNGGDSDYEWWNKVNSNFMRVYVPAGSQLISASGQTREVIEPPLDYEKLGFKTDQDVVSEEQNMIFDDETGTRIYQEDGKTVFGNWVYVSPKETVEVEYVYSLPFKIMSTDENDHIDTYSLLVQKQPGSVGSELNCEVQISSKDEVVWKFPENIELVDQRVNFSTKLKTDKFIGIVMQKK